MDSMTSNSAMTGLPWASNHILVLPTHGRRIYERFQASDLAHAEGSRHVRQSRSVWPDLAFQNPSADNHVAGLLRKTHLTSNLPNIFS
jgi:hypothetical protein